MRFSVALCTYNGSFFVKEQLDSILQQTLLPSQIVISDDQSQDNTIEVLNDYVKAHPHVEFVILENETNVGVIKNFERCLKRCSGDFIFFADQDDVWEKNKIAAFADFIIQSGGSSDEIFMAYSDLEIVDSKLQMLKPSFLHETHFKLCRPDKDQFQELIIRNWIPGCASVISRKLQMTALPFPNTVHMHDHWVALIAICYGRLLFLNKPLIKYRQHLNNEIGISLSWKKRLKKSASQLWSGLLLKRLNEKAEQACLLIKRGQSLNLTPTWPWLEKFICALNQGKIFELLSRPSASVIGFALIRILLSCLQAFQKQIGVFKTRKG